MSNGDRIRNMNNEELAEFLDKFDTLRDISSLYCSLGACVHKKDCLAGQECVEHENEYIKECLILALIVFIIENVYGGRVARRLAFRIVSQGKDREAFVILMVQIFTVCIMCPSMSLVASIMFKNVLFHGVNYFFATWIQTIAVNIPMAFTWQLAICGPIVRLINRKIVVPLEEKCMRSNA